MDGSEFYKLANKFKKQFQDQYNKIKVQYEAEESRNATVDLDRQPTLEEQTQSAHNIYLIKSEELGEIVTKLDEHCPSALDKTMPDKDEIEINIDNIDPRTFHMLDRMVRAFLPMDPVKKPKKKKATEDGSGPAAKKLK